MSDETAIATIESDEGVKTAIRQMQRGDTSFYSSIVGDDFETRAAVLEAVMSSESLADNLGATIDLANVIVQQIEMPDTQTGELRPVPRVLLIDASGRAFHAISGPVFRDVQNIIGILGQPSSWPKPLSIRVVQEGAGTRRYFTVKLGGTTKGK